MEEKPQFYPSPTPISDDDLKEADRFYHENPEEWERRLREGLQSAGMAEEKIQEIINLRKEKHEFDVATGKYDQ